jgi:hypothetical protein
MSKVTVPKAPIPVSGFPICAADYGCDYEVAEKGGTCAIHGGPPASLEMIHRSIHRQLKSCVSDMMGCLNCKGRLLKDTRCHRCNWMRGAAMGMAGLAEQLGWAEEMGPYLDLIALRRDGA